MKRILCFIALFTAAVCGTSCERNYGPAPTVISTHLQVFSSGELAFEDYLVKWELEKQQDDTYTLYMNDTRFVEGMPMLDMEVRGMVNGAQSEEGLGFSFKTQSIIPYYAGKEYDRYTLTGFSCSASNDGNDMEVTFTCAGYDVTYTQTLEHLLYE